LSGTVVLEDKWPVLGRHARAAGWLQLWVDLGRAPRTIDAYARGLAENLEVCEREGVDPATAGRAHIGVFMRELTERPSRRGANVVALDSGSGLSNATIQQRIVPVRLFYDHLMEAISRCDVQGPPTARPVKRVVRRRKQWRNSVASRVLERRLGRLLARASLTLPRGKKGSLL
jgi:site-specific recombinase XerC